jgi:hypothetical protein
MYCTYNNLTYFTTFFKDYNLLIVCNNHLCKYFNFIDFVTSKYIRQDCLKMI